MLFELFKNNLEKARTGFIFPNSKSVFVSSLNLSNCLQQTKYQQRKQNIFYKEEIISLCHGLKEHSPTSYFIDAKATRKKLPHCLYTFSETANFLLLLHHSCSFIVRQAEGKGLIQHTLPISKICSRTKDKIGC